MWISSGTRFLVGALIAAAPFARGADDADALHYLLSLQDPSGCWTSAASIRSTAAALLALAGQPAQSGVAEAARRGTDWLAAQQAKDGGWGSPDTAACGVEHGLSFWALAEWQVIQPVAGRSNLLARAAARTVAAQQKEGGWASTMGRTSKPSRFSTAVQMQSLVAAGRAGVTSRQQSDSLQRAGRHLLAYQDPGTGLLDGPAATGAAVFGWQALGNGLDPAVRRAVVAAQQAGAQWPRRMDEPLLETLLAYAASARYRPWPATGWDRDIRQQLDARRRPGGGWPASTAEPQGGPAYATAMGLLLEQVPVRFAPRSPAAEPDPLTWRVEGPGGAWWLQAALPLREEDALLIPRSATLLAGKASQVYGLTDDKAGVAALKEAGLSGIVLRLLDWNQQLVDAGWQFEVNWQNYASPRVLPARPLLRREQATACLAAVLRDLADHQAAVDGWSGTQLAAALDEAVSCAQSGREDELAGQPLRRLPPEMAAIWMRHRQAMVAALVERLREPRAVEPGALCCLPAWYVLGDGGLLDELRWHGFGVARDPLSR